MPAEIRSCVEPQIKKKVADRKLVSEEFVNSLKSDCDTYLKTKPVGRQKLAAKLREIEPGVRPCVIEEASAFLKNNGTLNQVNLNSIVTNCIQINELKEVFEEITK